MVAVLAAMVIGTSYAGTYSPGGGVIVTSDQPALEITSTTEGITAPVVDGKVQYRPFTKDGDGNTFIASDITMTAALYVREGIFTVQGSETELTINTGTGGMSSGSGATIFSVAGKNSTMVVDGAKIGTAVGAAMSVGGPDGSGTLLLTNGAKVYNKPQGSSLFIGYESNKENLNWSNVHASTKSPTDTTRYEGTYTPSANGQTMFGKGIVSVEGGSELWTGYSGVFIGEGELNVKDNSKMYSGYDHGRLDWDNDSLTSQIGGRVNATSVVNVSNGSLLSIGSWLSVANVDNTTVIINIDNAKILSESSYGTDIGYMSEVSSTTEINITNGGSFEHDLLALGNDAGTGKVTVNIDQDSSYKVLNDMQVRNAATINNAGTTKADMIYLEKGSRVNNTGAVEASSIEISGGTLSMNGAQSSVKANTITVDDGGTLQAAGGDPISIDSDSVTVEDGGIISLTDGSTLAVTGALTMGSGSILRLSANDYAAGDTLLSSENGDLDVANATVEVTGGQANYIIKDGVIYLTAVFDNSIAEALTVTNWGIATASRTFVNAVRGQRTNTGCIANGRGTAWAAVLGATSDIGSGDVDLKGAAVGADMKVGEKSSLGVAFGYIDGDAKIPGMSKAEQEGTYVALYGEHGLKKLSATSCLSLDWVAAYGQTDTEWESADWEQDSLQLNTRLNWNKKLTDRLCMSVFGGLEYFTSESDRVENAKTGSIQNLRGEIGVGARYVAWGTPGSEAVTDEKGATIAAARPGCEKLVLHGEIRYMNDLVRSNPIIEQDGLRGSGDNPGRQGMGIEAGATYRISERWSASANYGFNTMEDSKEHRVNVGASYTF